MEQRTVERFRKRVILIHWLQAASFAVLLITGSIMFFDLTSVSGGQPIRIIHKISAVSFAIMPLVYTLFDPRAVLNFLKEAFSWDGDARSWLRGAASFYFGRRTQMPPQGYINGDQKLWQLVVTVCGTIFIITGILMWFFQFKMPRELYQWISLTHGLAFIVISFMFLVHFYLTVLHQGFEESLGAMIDGKVSSSYARKNYSKWYAEQPDEEVSE
ncbi:MAG: cytochrome b/b6 domain-containing protein [Dehalococcoidales bacterium]